MTLATFVRHLSLFVALLSVAACGSSREDEAKALYDQACQAFDSDKLALAKVLSDSIRANYADVPLCFRNARELIKRIAQVESERTVAYLDSMLAAHQQVMADLADEVVIDDTAAVMPIYVAKSQMTRRAFDRSLLKASVDMNGHFFVSSNFTSDYQVHHDHVIVRAGEQFVETEPVVASAFRHEFSDGEFFWESVKYSGDDAARLALFVIGNAQESITVDFRGARTHHVIYLTDTDKKAIADVWRFATSLSEANGIKEMLRKEGSAVR